MGKRQHNGNDFIVSLSGINIDTTAVNIEEMDGYCRERGRLANVVTRKRTYEHVDPINYSLIMNYTKPKPRVVTVKNDKPFADVYKIISERFKGGLIVAESDTISEDIIKDFCKNENWQKNDIDIMICESFASLNLEEIKRANLFRISADPDVDLSILMKAGEFMPDAVGSVMIAQFFVNDNYNNVIEYINVHSKKYEKLGLNDFIDYGELNRQFSYFLYVDLDSGKILNLERQVLKDYLQANYKRILPNMPPDKIPGYVDYITLD